MDNDLNLNRFEEDFSAATADQPISREPVPDGRYLASVEKVEIAETRAGVALKWMLRILGPEYEGRLLWHCNVFGSVEAMRWLKTDLKICGVELNHLENLPHRLRELLDLTIEVNKRTKGDRDRTYFNRCVQTRSQAPQERRPLARASF